jgi:VRR-NUC domain
LSHRPTTLERVTESELQAAIIDVARVGGWLVNHQRPAQTRSGRWITATQGDTGFPDLVLVHDRRRLVVFAELKAQRGRPSPFQQVWLHALDEIGSDQVRAYLWRPGDWPEIVALLCPDAVVVA